MENHKKFVKNIQLIVKKFLISEDKSLPDFNKINSTSLRFEKIVDYVDDNREFKDLMTKFVVNEFYKTDEKNANFIQLITDLFEGLIEQYISIKDLDENDILFLYKGGNVLRVLALEAISYQPGEIKKILIDSYEQFFKKSDADFTIYINPNLEEELFHSIHHDLSILTYICLNYIRAIFFTDLDGFFSYASLSSLSKSKILNSYLDKLNSSESLTDPNNEHFGGKFLSLRLGNEVVGTEDELKESLESTGEKKINFGGKATGSRQDHLIIDDAENNEIVYFTTPLVSFFEKYNLLETAEERNMYNFIIKPLGLTSSSSIYVSYNSTLDFEKSKFNLMRSKINFSSTFQNKDGNIVKKNLNGELIDVSIIDLRTLKLPGMSVHENLERVKEYNDIRSGIKMSFKSYSLNFFIHDLIFIIFENSTYPWEDRKYAKRLARLLFLYLIDMMDNRYGMDVNDRLNFIRTLKSSFDEVKNKTTEFTKDPELIERIKNNFVQYNYNLKEILKYLEEILGKSPTDNVDEYNSKLTKFIDDILDNINIMENYLIGLQKYLSQQGLMNQSDLYNFKQLGGNKYLKKYIKYKEKYLKLKKELNY